MDLFGGVLPFTAVAEARSFRRAAEQLGVTPAAVSKAVAKLEEELGVVLLHRTTRRVELSPEGALLLERYRAAIDLVKAGREQVGQAQSAPRGTVRLSTSPILGPLLTRHLPQLWRRHAGLQVELSLSDRVINLVEDQIDIAVRVGPLPDSALVARRLMHTRWVTLASPAYLAERGIPSSPDDLRHHDAIRFLAPSGKPVDFTFLARPGREGSRPLSVSGPLLIDHGTLLLDAAAADGGVVQALDYMAAEHLRSGRLVEVLRAWAAPGPDVNALSLKSARRTRRVRATLDFLQEALAPRPPPVRQL
jgi:LysR family transcriptional regulator for bpeEF and oprC